MFLCLRLPTSGNRQIHSIYVSAEQTRTISFLQLSSGSQESNKYLKLLFSFSFFSLLSEGHFISLVTEKASHVKKETLLRLRSFNYNCLLTLYSLKKICWVSRIIKSYDQADASFAKSLECLIWRKA